MDQGAHVGQEACMEIGHTDTKLLGFQVKGMSCAQCCTVVREEDALYDSTHIESKKDLQKHLWCGNWFGAQALNFEYGIPLLAG